MGHCGRWDRTMSEGNTSMNIYIYPWLFVCLCLVLLSFSSLSFFFLLSHRSPLSSLFFASFSSPLCFSPMIPFSFSFLPFLSFPPIHLFFSSLFFFCFSPMIPFSFSSLPFFRSRPSSFPTSLYFSFFLSFPLVPSHTAIASHIHLEVQFQIGGQQRIKHQRPGWHWRWHWHDTLTICYSPFPNGHRSRCSVYRNGIQC